jgi:glycosyltransferase involved in cell wall biosynthesis
MSARADPISYFVRCYRCADTVGASVDSILRGNLRPEDEIVMVEDGSGDATWDVLQSLAARHSEIRLVRHEANRGVAVAGNSAVRNACHDLLFCLDSDNLLSPGSVPRLQAHLKAQSADIAAFAELWYFLHALPKVTHRWVFRDVITLADCFAGSVTPPASGNYLFKRSSWEKAGGFPEVPGVHENWGLGIRMLATGARMVTLPDTHYLHRYGHESSWVRLSQAGQTSVAATEVVAPFFDRFPPGAILAMTEEPTCYDWFQSMDQRPLATKEGLGHSGRVDKPFPHWWQRPSMRRALRGLE